MSALDSVPMPQAAVISSREPLLPAMTNERMFRVAGQGGRLSTVRDEVLRRLARLRAHSSRISAVVRAQGRQFTPRCQLLVVGPIGFPAIGVGAVIALFVMATQALTGAPAFFAHDSLVMLSVVLIETGVVLIGLGLLAHVPRRIGRDSGHSKEHG